MLAFFNQAQNGGMTNAIMPGLDSTWIFNYADFVGIDCTSSQQPCLDV
jgi:hypothetical protein